MGCRVAFTRAAEADEEAIVAHLVGELHSPQAAGRFLDGLEKAVKLIAEMPESFPPVLEPRLAGKGYRKARVLDYLAVYRMEDEVAVIVRIFHARQDYAALL